MDKKIITPILLLGLSIAFVIVCVLLFINGNKYKKLIGIKFKLGALIISMQTMTSCFNYHYGTCYRPVFIPPYDKEKPLKIDKPNIGFTANAGIEQKFHKIDKISSWNFGFGPNFHKMNSKNTLFCGISFKNYINKEIYDGSLFGVNVGMSHLTKFKFNYFTNVDVNFGSNNISKFYNSYGVNLGTRINDFLLFHDTHFGMDIYGRFEYSSKELQFQDNIYVGIKLYYGFFGR